MKSNITLHINKLRRILLLYNFLFYNKPSNWQNHAMTARNKVAVYARVSTDRQDTGLEAQIRALEAYCRAKGFPDFEVFSDSNVSGSKESRPGLDRLMAAVRSKTLQCVVVYSFSRFARSTKHLLTALEEMKANQVSFISLSEQIDTSSPIGKAVFVIVAAIAELERELIRERVRNGVANARGKGKMIGRPRTRPSALIQVLVKEGHTYREIAKLVGCSQGAIAAEVQVMRRSENAVSEHKGMLG